MSKKETREGEKKKKGLGVIWPSHTTNASPVFFFWSFVRTDSVALRRASWTWMGGVDWRGEQKKGSPSC